MRAKKKKLGYETKEWMALTTFAPLPQSSSTVLVLTCGETPARRATLAREVQEGPLDNFSEI